MKKRGGQVKDITGQKFNKLLVLEYIGIKNHKAVWKCKCDCGTIKNFTGQDLRSGNTNSCGCYMVEQIQKANTKHKATLNKNPTNGVNNKSKTKLLSIRDYPFKFFKFEISTDPIFRKTETSNANPTATSAAATVIEKNTNTSPLASCQ